MHLLAGLGAWFAPLIGRIPYNKGAVENAKAAELKQFAYLEKTLADKTFLVGNRITVADIYVASVIIRGLGLVRLFRPSL